MPPFAFPQTHKFPVWQIGCIKYQHRQRIPNMKSTFLFLFFASINLLPGGVDGAASFDPTVFCSRIASSFRVCASASYTSPSPATLENGVTIYVGGYSSSYTIVKGLMEGEMNDGNSENDAGITIDVVRDDSDNCTVSVALNASSAIMCNSCKYCGDESFKADCSNVKNGRKMNMCESAEEDDVFFPLTALALLKINNTTVRAPVTAPRRPPVAEPRRAPVNQPRRAPVAEPRKAPVRAPITEIVREPRRAPVAQPRRAPVAQPRRAPVAQPRRAPVAQPRRAPVKAPVKTPVQV